MTEMTARRPFWSRFAEYASDRFPLGNNVIGAGVFAASAAFAYSGIVDGRLPETLPLLATVLVVIGMFFILRVSDEFKDAEDDATYRPEQPVPRGLITLSELRNTAIVVAVLQALLLLVVAPGVFPVLILTWGWTVLMTFEFGIGHALKRRPIAYLVSHMLVMPFIALLACSVSLQSMAPLGQAVGWSIGALAFFSGLVLEVGRKVWDVEREGVDTYSKLWGRTAAQAAWQILVAVLIGGFACVLVLLEPSLIAATIAFLFAVSVFAITKRNIDGHRLSGKAIASASVFYVLAIQVLLGAIAWLP